MTNLRKGRSYKLNMQNLMKPHAMYNLGMQPLAYSEVCATPSRVRSRTVRSLQRVLKDSRHT